MHINFRSALAKDLESSIRRAAFDFALFEGVEKLAVALSGGKDSLTLLFFLHALKGRGFPPFELLPIHVTGEFSCGAGVDLPYLQEVCAFLELPLVVAESSQKREGLECYSCSRERRKLIFHEAKNRGATAVAFGHHQDDLTETLLLNLLHKAEFAGMLPKVPMHRYGVTIIRPLIYLQEKKIREFARESGFQRITCQCPVGQNSRRKRVDDLIDLLEKEFPHARSNLAKASILYGSDKAAAALL